MKTLENNVALFGHLYIFMKNHDGDFKEFFSHEIQFFSHHLCQNRVGFIYLTQSQIF